MKSFCYFLFLHQYASFHRLSYQKFVDYQDSCLQTRPLGTTFLLPRGILNTEVIQTRGDTPNGQLTHHRGGWTWPGCLQIINIFDHIIFALVLPEANCFILHSTHGCDGLYWPVPGRLRQMLSKSRGLCSTFLTFEIWVTAGPNTRFTSDDFHRLNNALATLVGGRTCMKWGHTRAHLKGPSSVWASNNCQFFSCRIKLQNASPTSMSPCRTLDPRHWPDTASLGEKWKGPKPPNYTTLGQFKSWMALSPFGRAKFGRKEVSYPLVKYWRSSRGGQTYVGTAGHD